VQPRLETVVAGDGSLAPSVLAAADELGVTLDGWQKYVIERLFTTAGDRLAVRTGLISVARQNGKTTLAETVVYWWLSRQPFGPDTVLLVSHDLRLTSVIYERVVAHLEAHGHLGEGSRRRFKATYSFGRQTATLANGSKLAVQADTPSAGHGFARVGLVVGDEIWGVHDTAWDHGLLPTQRVHPSPLALMLSTAGDESSALFRRWREKGLALVDSGRPSSFLMLEWSLPAGVDPADPVWWGWANPCLGDRLTMATLVEESEAPDRTAFLRASLNMWVASAKAWLEPGVWEALRVDLGDLAGGWVAAEVSRDGERFIAVRAAPWQDGIVAVETVVHEDTEDAFWKALADVMVDRTLQLAVSPSLLVHLPDQYADRHQVVGYRELGLWTGLVRSLICDQRVAHRGEAMLSEHVTRAVATKSESGMALASARSPGPIDAARCTVWAVALVTTPPKPVRTPAVARPGVRADR
jgi:hypothetical protein